MLSKEHIMEIQDNIDNIKVGKKIIKHYSRVKSFALQLVDNSSKRCIWITSQKYQEQRKYFAKIKTKNS